VTFESHESHQKSPDRFPDVQAHMTAHTSESVSNDESAEKS
jgi:hypothetical protein